MISVEIYQFFVYRAIKNTCNPLFRKTNIIPKTAKCKQNGGVFGVSATRPDPNAN